MLVSRVRVRSGEGHSQANEVVGAGHKVVEMSIALEGAERKGREAFLTGKPRSACPYKDKRQDYRNIVTWSRAFITAWHDGYDEAEKRYRKPSDMIVFDEASDISPEAWDKLKRD